VTRFLMSTELSDLSRYVVRQRPQYTVWLDRVILAYIPRCFIRKDKQATCFGIFSHLDIGVQSIANEGDARYAEPYPVHYVMNHDRVWLAKNAHRFLASCDSQHFKQGSEVRNRPHLGRTECITVCRDHIHPDVGWVHAAISFLWSSSVLAGLAMRSED